MIYFNPIKTIFFMLLFAAMMFGDVSARNDDLPTNKNSIDADNSLKTPLVEKGLPKLIIPAQKYTRSVTATSTPEAHLHKNNPPRPVQNLSSNFLIKNKKTL